MVQIIKPERPKFESEIVNMLRGDDESGETSEIVLSALDRNRRNPMHKRVGLWLDRKKAVIVSIANNIEAKRIITSDMEHYVLYSTTVPGDGSPENVRDRRFWNRLGEYYDKIIEHIRDGVEIQIFGPAEAKYELQKRLEQEGLWDHVVSIEEAGILTDLQITTRVQNRFPSRSRFDFS